MTCLTPSSLTLLTLALSLMLLSLASHVQSEHYHIVSSSTGLCDKHPILNEKYFTLEEFQSTVFDEHNITVSFSPGEHLLTHPIYINSTTDVTIIGQKFRDTLPTIKCIRNGGFEFSDIQTLKIAYIELTSCQGDGGAISMNRVDKASIIGCQIFASNQKHPSIGALRFYNSDVSINNCQFTTNSADNNGGAIYVYNGNVSINNSQFSNNTADTGGAIYVYNGNVSINNSQFSNNTADTGGVMDVYYGSISINNSQFTNNRADHYGGVIYIYNGSISINNSQFTNNTADHYGGAMYVYNGSISINNSRFTNNTADTGGVMIVSNGKIYFNNSQFANNTSDNNGGAIYVYNGNVSINKSQFTNNTADTGGAMDVYNGNISIDNSQFTNNTADTGGAMDVYNGNISIDNSQFTNNTADNNGGAINAYNGSISINNSQFTINTADMGGVMDVYNGNISFNNSQFTNNTSDEGGAIYVSTGNASINNCQFTNNTSDNNGGAVYVYNGNVSINNSQFTNNTADKHGGAIDVTKGNISINNCQFTSNTAFDCGAIFVFDGNICINNSQFTSNMAREAGAMYLTEGSTMIRQTIFFNNSADSKHILNIESATMISLIDVNFTNNNGSLYVFNSQVEFNGSATFNNNTGESGGAINAIQSQIYINGVMTISNNTATYGGGISLSQSTLVVSLPIEISGNKADTGGGIYAYQSVIEFKSERPENKRLNISNNVALLNGAGLYAIASNIKISRSFVHFCANRANGHGGAIYLEQNTKMFLLKYTYEGAYNGQTLPISVRLDITNNSAKYNGGGIYIADNTTTGALCQQINPRAEEELASQECFIQTIRLYRYNRGSNTINTFFDNNFAGQSGRDTYGGLLDRCTINPFAEALVPDYDNRNRFTLSNGFDYIKVTAQFEQIVNYSQDPFNLPHVITKSQVKDIISSDAVQVLYCHDETFHSHHSTVSTRKGEMFKISVVAVDQVGNPVNATILSSVSSESGFGRLKEGQTEQNVVDHCTELEYNVYSRDSLAQVQLYADGPCIDLGISKQSLNILFLPCTCSTGFQPTSSQIDCMCDCNQRLKDNQVTNCSYENRSIQLETNIWIGVDNETSGLIIHDCPFDYCVDKPVNISLRNSYELDKQCSNGRTGIMCGECEKGLSLVFATSRCKDCSNNFLFLLIPFALAGIVLVVFILLLNVTVATGTIHGMIFYANILASNRSIFIPFKSLNLLTVFVSWFNLDLGIETCFYDGMNSQAKILLQLVFPAYLFLLIFLLIILCEYSTRFSALLSKKNPIAALCTLILLSYTKLLHMIIATLQYTFIDYPDGSNDIVWLFDANVQYFSVSHIPRFIAAFIIVIVGSMYTILLFFGQWLPRCSNWKIMKWTKNTKYNAFIDAYHAPFTPKHRYWIGLLLFTQIVHNLVVAMATDTFLPVLSAGCVALGLIVVKVLSKRMYKNKLQDSLETLFLLNIGVLAYGTSYVGDTHQNQQALAIISMAISFILFLGIICYHFYTYILKNTRVWAKVTQTIHRRPHNRNRREMYQVVPDDDEPIEEPDYNDLQRDTIDPPYTGDSREQTDPKPHQYFLRPAVHYDQLREPDLDVLDPINTDDYRVPLAAPRFHEPPVITYTVIDAIPKPDKPDLPDNTRKNV